MVDIMGLMKKAQAVQAKMKDVQEELERLEVEGQSGGGMVKITLNGKGQMKAVALVAGSTAPTLRENATAREAERLSGVAANPLVRKIMTHFPGAQIVEVRSPDAPPAPEAMATGDDEVAYADAIIVEDDV